MHAPDNVMELPFPPCACGHMHSPQIICAAGFGEQRDQRKKRLADFIPAVFMFSVQQPNMCLLQHVFTSLLKTNKKEKSLWEEKKTQQNISFNSSSVAEVVG